MKFSLIALGIFVFLILGALYVISKGIMLFIKEHHSKKIHSH